MAEQCTALHHSYKPMARPKSLKMVQNKSMWMGFHAFELAQSKKFGQKRHNNRAVLQCYLIFSAVMRFSCDGVVERSLLSNGMPVSVAQ